MAALNGNGGRVSLTAGTGGIVAASASNSTAEIATAGAVSLNTAGPIGSRTNRIQFDAARTLDPSSVSIGRQRTSLPGQRVNIWMAWAT